MIDLQFLDGLARFNLILNKRVTSNYSGQRKSIFQGKGMLFKDHRIYAPGDDFRAIDWKIFAKTDDLMIKNYEEEKNLSVHIIVDKSLSMDFGNPKKFDYAAMIGVGYAYLAMKNNDKFQFATFSEDLEVYQPRKGVSQLISMIDYLNSIKTNGKTDLAAIAQKYKRYINSRSLIVIISDFLTPIESIRESLYYFAGNEVVFIQVLDSFEKDMDIEGDFKLKDSESKLVMRSFMSAKAREDYINKLEHHSSAIEDECNALGIKYFQVTTDMPIFDTFNEILRNK